MNYAVTEKLRTAVSRIGVVLWQKEFAHDRIWATEHFHTPIR